MSLSLSHKERLLLLAKKREGLESLSEEKALETILSDPEIMPLIHSYTEEDFFLLMHRIGVDDFLPILSLATDEQWHFIMDMELWKDQLPDYKEMTLWLDRFMRADPRRFVSFMLEKEGDLMDAWLFRNVEVYIREHDEDPSDLLSDFLTLDDVLYFRPLDNQEDDYEKAKLKDRFIRDFADNLARISHELYFKIFQEMPWSVVAELEEMALHWRFARMREKGFVPKEEALSLFQPLREGELEKKSLSLRRKKGKNWAVIPENGKRMLSDAGQLIPFFNDLEDLIPDFELELAHLCNRFMVASSKIIRSRELLDEAARSVLGYLHIGILRIAGKEELDKGLCLDILQGYSLEDIFRAGFGPLMKLKWKLETWLKKAWFRKSGLALSFWEERGLGILGGLLLDIPMHFDQDLSLSSYYRPFADNKELAEAEDFISKIILLDELLALLGLYEVDPGGSFLSWKNLLLTLWLKDSLNAPELSRALEAVHIELFRSFFAGMREEREGRFFLSDQSKEDFINFLSLRTGLEKEILRDKFAFIFEELFNELDLELSEVKAEFMDHRYIRFFLLREL